MNKLVFKVCFSRSLTGVQRTEKKHNVETFDDNISIAIAFPGHVETAHNANMSMKCTPPYTLHFQREIGVSGVLSYFFVQKIDCGSSLECLTEAILTFTHNLCLEQKIIHK